MKGLELLRWLIPFIVASCAVVVTAQVQSLPPIGRPPQQTGTGRIKGRVVDAQSGSAVVRTRIRISGPQGNPVPVVTDESGSFEVAKLPAGRFLILAEKPGYAPARYPEQGRTIRGSHLVTVAEDETVENVVIPLYRAAAITGRVVDARGDPVEFAQVSVFRVPSNGRGTPMPRGGAPTNDLGEFRVSKLEPGSYVLLARQHNQFDDGSDVQPMATYFPSAVSIAEAQPIPIARAQTVAGIEIVLVDAIATSVSGTVLDSNGQPAHAGSIQVRRITDEFRDGGVFGAPVRPDGTFKLKLAPGEYDVEVRAPRAGVMGPYRPGDELFGVTHISAAGAPITDLTVQLAPGAVISGRLVFDGQGSPPDDPSAMRINVGTMTPMGMCQPGRSEVLSDWTFRIEGATGTCTIMPSGTGRWTMKSARRDEINLMDHPVRFAPGDVIHDVEVMFTDRRTELALDVTDDHGLPTREYVALVFPLDKKLWSENSRYVRLYVPLPPPVVSNATNGSPAIGPAPPPRRDSIVGLPAGEYYVAAVDDLPIEGSRDAPLLQSLVSSATRVTVTDTAPVRLTVRRAAAPR